MQTQSAFTRSCSKVEDWFGTGQDFEATLVKAIHNEQNNPKNLDFLVDIKQRWEEHGMCSAMSRKVYLFLCNLAEVNECP